jgi:excisionase family DNA binding protein
MGGRERVEVSEVLTRNGLAADLHSHVATIDKLVKNGQIPAFRVAEHWRFRLDKMDDWIRESQK